MDYKWNLKDTIFTKDKGKVFSCFACGGGSTMGYKLAGFDVIGCNEIDKKMNECYIKNHNPKFNFLEDIRTFKNKIGLPKELYNLDILDGSPPCSSFSMAGNREKDWGKEKKFREGQSEQVLDTLFFDFIDLAKRLQPKIIIAENVKGLLLGEAQEYMNKILVAFTKAGYKVDYKLLDASTMGVPQKRERVFFYAIRNDLLKYIDTADLFGELPHIMLNFKYKPIPFKEIQSDKTDRELSKTCKELWEDRQETDTGLQQASARLHNKPNNWFSYNYVKKNKVMPTILGNDWTVLYDEPRHPNKEEYCLAGSFPLDYDFMDNKPHYMIGMSVPPLMIYEVANQVSKQWLENINI